VEIEKIQKKTEVWEPNLDQNSLTHPSLK